jgi:hypothetical protein
MNRRKFCLSSVAAAMSAAAFTQTAPAAAAASTPTARLYRFIYDRRYAVSRDFGLAARHARSTAQIVAIDGNITALWSRDLRQQWGAGGGAIAGMTTARTLFCLELLAKDHRLRVVARAEHAPSGGGVIAHRLAASEPMIARMSLALADAEWARKMPAVLSTWRLADGGPRVTRVVGPAGLCRGVHDDELVSFVIA